MRKRLLLLVSAFSALFALAAPSAFATDPTDVNGAFDSVKTTATTSYMPAVLGIVIAVVLFGVGLGWLRKIRSKATSTRWGSSA